MPQEGLTIEQAPTDAADVPLIEGSLESGTAGSAVAQSWIPDQSGVFTHEEYPLDIDPPMDKIVTDLAWNKFDKWRTGGQKAVVDMAYTYATMENSGSTCGFNHRRVFDTLVDMATLGVNLQKDNYSLLEPSVVGNARTVLNNAVVLNSSVHPNSESLSRWRTTTGNKWEVQGHDEAKQSVINQYDPNRIYA